VTIHVDIPDSVAGSLRLPPPEVESRLRTELALTLYAQGILGFGKASELSGASRYRFAELVSSRGIPRHYTNDELTQDLDYGRGQ